MKVWILSFLITFCVAAGAEGAVVLSEGFESGLDTATWQTFSDTSDTIPYNLYYPEVVPGGTVGTSGLAGYNGGYLRAAAIDQANNLGDERVCGIIYKTPLDIKSEPLKISWQAFEWADGVGIGLTPTIETDFDSMTAIWVWFVNTDIWATEAKSNYDTPTIPDNPINAYNAGGPNSKAYGTAQGELTIERIDSGMYGITYRAWVNSSSLAEDFATQEPIVFSPHAQGQEIWKIPEIDAEQMHVMFFFQDVVPNVFSAGNDTRFDTITISRGGAGQEVPPEEVKTSLSLSWSSFEGAEYRVFSTEDLTSWEDISGTITGTGGEVTYADTGDTVRPNPAASTVKRRYYNVLRTR